MVRDVKAIRDVLEKMAEDGSSQTETVDILDVGNDAYLSYFENEVLDGYVLKGGSTCRFYEGANGSGKTHFLQMLNKLASKKGMVVARIDLAQATSLEDWQSITRCILENMEAVICGERVKSLPEILAALGRQNKVDINLLSTALLPHAGFRNAMVSAVQMKDTRVDALSVLKDFLLGKKVAVPELSSKGLVGIKNPLSNRNAELVLKTVLGGLHYLGLTGTMLLFDENEKTLVAKRTIPTKKMKIGANLIRRLIDGCTNGNLNGTLAIFAVLPGFLENCAMIYPALGQRLQIVRGLNKPAWRWPVMPLDLVNSISDPQEFMQNIIGKFGSLVRDFGGNLQDFRLKALKAGQIVLDSHIGSGYKRELIKVLADQALKVI